jgi:hypothetical protein
MVILVPNFIQSGCPPIPVFSGLDKSYWTSAAVLYPLIFPYHPSPKNLDWMLDLSQT